MMKVNLCLRILMIFSLFIIPLSLQGRLGVLAVDELGSNAMSVFYNYPSSYHNNPLATRGGFGMSFAAPTSDSYYYPASGSIQGAYPAKHFTIAPGIIMTDKALERYTAWDMYTSLNLKTSYLTLGYTQHFVSEGYLSDDVSSTSLYGDIGIGTDKLFGTQHLIVNNIDNDDRSIKLNLASPEHITKNAIPGIDLSLIGGIGVEHASDEKLALKIGFRSMLSNQFSNKFRVITNASWHSYPANLSFSQMYSGDQVRGTLYAGWGLRFYKDDIVLSAEFGLILPTIK